jgi:hypothetical protein
MPHNPHIMAQNSISDGKLASELDASENDSITLIMFFSKILSIAGMAPKMMQIMNKLTILDLSMTTNRLNNLPAERGKDFIVLSFINKRYDY